MADVASVRERVKAQRKKLLEVNSHIQQLSIQREALVSENAALRLETQEHEEVIAAAEEQEQALLDKNLTLRKRVEKESEETKKVQERLLEQQRTYERHLRSVEDAEEHASGRSEAEQISKLRAMIDNEEREEATLLREREALHEGIREFKQQYREALERQTQEEVQLREEVEELRTQLHVLAYGSDATPTPKEQ